MMDDLLAIAICISDPCTVSGDGNIREGLHQFPHSLQSAFKCLNHRDARIFGKGII